MFIILPVDLEDWYEFVVDRLVCGVFGIAQDKDR